MRLSAQAKARAREMGDRPLAQYEDNLDRDQAMRAMSRWDDPMKDKTELSEAKAKLSVRRRYEGPPAPPNRFGIEPGYEWDGVDRSNGYEAQLFRRDAKARSKAKSAFRMATEDM